MLGKSNILYEKYVVCYPQLVGKFGIFMFPHQPVFSDLEGACGKKELQLIDNQKHFELSAIEEIIDIIPIGIKKHNIFTYRLKDVRANPLDIVRLIEYVLESNYNTAWDKNLWEDIYGYSYVRDIADWFVSCKLSHKLGTIYALLNSLHNSDIYLYVMLLKEILNTYNSEKIFVIYYSALIVRKYCPKLFDKFEQDINEATPEVFEALLRLLFSGKACCHLENDEEWNWVREYYCKRINMYKRIYSKKIQSKKGELYP